MKITRILPDHSLLCATFMTTFYNNIERELPSVNNYIPCQVQQNYPQEKMLEKFLKISF